MDQNRLKKIIQSALEISFSSITLTINEFDMVEINELNDDQIWEPSNYTLFIGLKRGKTLNNSQTLNTIDIERFLETLIGFDCCVDFI